MELQIPFSFGPGGSRSTYNLLYGPPKLDLPGLISGTPTTPEQYTTNRNVAVLETLQLENLNKANSQFDIQSIGTFYGVSQSSIDRALAQAAELRPKIIASKRLERTYDNIELGAKALIAAAWAFIGGQALSLAYTPAATLPAGTYGPVAPLTVTQGAVNYGVTGLSTAAYSVPIKIGSQIVIDILGPKIGGGLLQLLSGNFQGAIESFIRTPSPSIPGQSINLFGPTNGSYGGSSGGSGGGGGGFLPSSGQSQLSTGIIPVLGIGVVLLAVWYFLRKRG